MQRGLPSTATPGHPRSPLLGQLPLPCLPSPACPEPCRKVSAQVRLAARSRDEPDVVQPLRQTWLLPKRTCMDRKQSVRPETSHPIPPHLFFQSWLSTGSFRDFHLRQYEMPKRPTGAAPSPVPSPRAPLPPRDPQAASPHVRSPPLRRRRRPRPARLPGGMPPASSPPRPPARGGVGGRSPRSHLVAAARGPGGGQLPARSRPPR